MEPTDFERWCAGEIGHTVEFIMSMRALNFHCQIEYMHHGIATIYRAYMAGVRSRLPYQTPEE